MVVELTGLMCFKCIKYSAIFHNIELIVAVTSHDWNLIMNWMKTICYQSRKYVLRKITKTDDISWNKICFPVNLIRCSQVLKAKMEIINEKFNSMNWNFNKRIQRIQTKMMTIVTIFCEYDVLNKFLTELSCCVKIF